MKKGPTLGYLDHQGNEGYSQAEKHGWALAKCTAVADDQQMLRVEMPLFQSSSFYYLLFAGVLSAGVLRIRSY